MYLERLELQGFKTFAKKTELTFPKQKRGENALTVIVGPNGSGKSNLSDAIRWCLGEQSMKHLRGKKAEDIIFSGSEGKGRSGFAEVTLTLNNEDKSVKIDYSQVTITRRLYRDGESEYLLNGKKARLTDIQLLLAEAGIGQRTYTVVGQGMIDHVLTSSPEERKIFFDDATGVRGLQIKRHQSMLKLKKSSEHLQEVELLLQEIEPRLRSLKRQVSRLEKREKVEIELRDLQEKYYHTSWWRLADEQESLQNRLLQAKQATAKKRTELEAGDARLLELEKANAGVKNEQSSLAQEAQAAYKKAQEGLAAARQRVFEAERELELSRVRSQSTWAPLPLHEIIKELEVILKADQQSSLQTILKLVSSLRDRLRKPTPEDFKPDPALLQAIESAKSAAQQAADLVESTEQEIDEVNKQANASQSELFTFQRELRSLQRDLYTFEQKENEINIHIARVETRFDALKKELSEEAMWMNERLAKKDTSLFISNLDETRSRVLHLKHELELIGGIDEETIQEYKQTEERYTFLSGQMTDIRDAIRGTEKIIDELDDTITKQSEKAFKSINTEFQKYFKILFGGGSCSLIKLKESEMAAAPEEGKVALDRAMEYLAEEKIQEAEESTNAILSRVKQRRDHVAGIDIQATPPGKKLKALNLLSGGERALTSIALLSAIMATNPSPFVVLDEVDAALDESNTVRFAAILNELRKLTQFIVVTHNRATMERADLLYGVTMGNDGISNLLSVSMTDIEEAGTARR